MKISFHNYTIEYSRTSIKYQDDRRIDFTNGTVVMFIRDRAVVTAGTGEGITINPDPRSTAISSHLLGAMGFNIGHARA